MVYVIRHESVNRIRLHLVTRHMSMEVADVVEYFLLNQDCVVSAKVYDRTGDVTIQYKPGMREELLQRIRALDEEDEQVTALVPENTGRQLHREYEERLMWLVSGRIFRNIFFPAPLQVAWTLMKSVKYIWKGLGVLMHGKIEVPLLDAIAITVSMLRGDFQTASSVMFLLDAGDLLEEWTHRKSVNDLAKSMALSVDKVWLRTAQDDVLVDIRNV